MAAPSSPSSSSGTKPLQRLFTCKGHGDEVNDVAVSEDGKLIASASDDCTVRLWDPSTGQPLHELKGHTNSVARVLAVAVFRSGAAGNESPYTIASGSVDGTIKLWGGDTGQLNASVDAKSRVECLAVWPNGLRMAAGHRYGGDHSEAVTLWALDLNGKGAQLLHVFKGHTNWVRSVAVQGDLIVSGSDDGTIKVWSVSQKKLLRTLKGHDKAVRGVALHGNTVVSASYDNSWRLWDVHSGKLKASYQGPDNNPEGLWSVAVSGNRVVLGAGNGALLVCSLSTGKLLRETPNVFALGVGVRGVAVHGKLIVSGGDSTTVDGWKIPTDVEPLTNEGLQKLVHNIENGITQSHIDLSGRELGDDMVFTLFAAIANQRNSTVRSVDLSDNPFSRFPVALLVLSPYNVLEEMDFVVLTGSAVRNIPPAYHHNIVPLLQETRGNASTSDEVHIVVLGDGAQGKTTVIDCSIFSELGLVLPKDLDLWEPKHVRVWAEKLNFDTDTCSFLEEAKVCGAMLNKPKDKVLTALSDAWRRQQAQQQQVPGEYVMRQVAAQSQKLRREAERVPKVALGFYSRTQGIRRLVRVVDNRDAVTVGWQSAPNEREVPLEAATVASPATVSSLPTPPTSTEAIPSSALSTTAVYGSVIGDSWRDTAWPEWNRPSEPTTVANNVASQPPAIVEFKERQRLHVPDTVQLTVLDLAGQPQYYVNHNQVLPRQSLVCVLVHKLELTPLGRTTLHMRRRLRHWLDMLGAKTGSKLPLFVVLTHCDTIPEDKLAAVSSCVRQNVASLLEPFLHPKGPFLLFGTQQRRGQCHTLVPPDDRLSFVQHSLVLLDYRVEECVVGLRLAVEEVARQEARGVVLPRSYNQALQGVRQLAERLQTPLSKEVGNPLMVTRQELLDSIKKECDTSILSRDETELGNCIKYLSSVGALHVVGDTAFVQPARWLSHALSTLLEQFCPALARTTEDPDRRPNGFVSLSQLCHPDLRAVLACSEDQMLQLMQYLAELELAVPIEQPEPGYWMVGLLDGHDQRNEWRPTSQADQQATLGRRVLFTSTKASSGSAADHLPVGVFPRVQTVLFQVLAAPLVCRAAASGIHTTHSNKRQASSGYAVAHAKRHKDSGSAFAASSTQPSVETPLQQAQATSTQLPPPVAASSSLSSRAVKRKVDAPPALGKRHKQQVAVSTAEHRVAFRVDASQMLALGVVCERLTSGSSPVYPHYVYVRHNADAGAVIDIVVEGSQEHSAALMDLVLHLVYSTCARLCPPDKQGAHPEAVCRCCLLRGALADVHGLGMTAEVTRMSQLGLRVAHSDAQGDRVEVWRCAPMQLFLCGTVNMSARELNTGVTVTNAPTTTSTFVDPATVTPYPAPTAQQLQRYANSAAYHTQVFLCHHGGDCKHTEAGALAFLLNKVGVCTFWDFAGLRDGDNAPQMGLACHKCSCAVVIFSPNFFKSKWTIKELKTFARRECESDSKQELIVPLFTIKADIDACAEQCKPYYPELKRRMYVDHTKTDSLASFVCRSFVRVLRHPELSAARDELDRLALDDFGSKASERQRVFQTLVQDWLKEYCLASQELNRRQQDALSGTLQLAGVQFPLFGPLPTDAATTK